jgi:hypothetical protein
MRPPPHAQALLILMAFGSSMALPCFTGLRSTGNVFLN